MDKLIILLIISAIGSILYSAYRKSLQAKRKKFIDNYQFPQKITQKICETYPHLNEQQANEVIGHLREYFHICHIAGKKMVAMPSQVVDVAWHEHILFTQEYANFCRKALGRFLHHTPAEAMRSPTRAQKGIKRAWKIACRREKISTTKPSSLPSLFALDSQLDIPNGFKYALNCKGSTGSYCATHIGCSSGCASGDSSSDTDSSDSGCSSSGCSGGCGGGD